MNNTHSQWRNKGGTWEPRAPGGTSLTKN